MSSSSEINIGLGDKGLHSGSGRGGPSAVILCDVRRGWQTGGKVTEADTAISDLNDKPARAKRLPPDGQNVAIRCLAAGASGTVTVNVYGFPEDPGTEASSSLDTGLNLTDGVAAGELIDTLTFTMTAVTADSPSVAADTDKKVSDVQIVDRRGYEYVVLYITGVTTLTIGDGVEVVYRVF